MKQETTSKKVKNEIGRIYLLSLPFDRAIEAKPDKSELITARDLAYARILSEPQSSLWQNGSYIREAVAYPDSMKDKSLFIRVSPLLNHKIAQKTIKAHRQGSEYFNDDLVSKQLEIAEKDESKPVQERRVLIVPHRRCYDIPVNKMCKSDEAVWLFKDKTEKYAERLSNQNISSFPIYFSGNSDKNFLNQLWLGILDGGSGLDGDDWDLGYYDQSRWVLREAPIGAEPHKNFRSNIEKSSKIVLPYTQREIDKHLKLVNGVREGKLPASKLEEVAGFFGKLKR